MAKLKHMVRGRNLVAAAALLSAIVLVAASCGGGGGGSGPVVGPGDPVIPIVPADDHGDTRSDATDLALGSSVQGQIEEGDDDDYFKVQVTEAGTLTVYTTGSLDTRGELQASDGGILASDDDGGDGGNFRIAHDVGPGAYYVRVSSDGTATGSYVVLASFVAEVLPPPPPADDHGDARSDATDLALGSSVQGQIEEGDDDDYFRVQVTEAGTLTVYTTGNLDTVGELQASNGSSLASDDDGGDGGNFRIAHDVGPGTYYVRVNSYGTATGSYVVLASFVAEVLPPPPPADDHGDTRSDATDLALGGAVQGQIEEGDDDDFFRVQVTEAGTLTVYTTGSLDTVSELQASDGSILASDDDGGDGGNFRIELRVDPGAYYVRVSSYGTATGSYVVLASFVAEVLPPPPPRDEHGDTRSDATDIVLGSSVSGHLNDGTDEDFFRFVLAEPSTVSVTLTARPGIEVALLDSDGNVLAAAVTASDGNVIVTVGDGTKYVRVRIRDQSLKELTGDLYQIISTAVPISDIISVINLIRGIPDVTISRGKFSVSLDLSEYFKAPVGSPLTFRASASIGGILTINVERSTLTISRLPGTQTGARDRPQ